MAPQLCPLCGESTLEQMQGTYQFSPPANIPGGMMVIADTTWQHCSSCGEDILSLELESAIARERYRRLGLLSPEEIREVRERTGLSAVDMGGLLGAGEKTYTRWENGNSIQTKASDTLIRLIDNHAEMFVLVEAEREPNRPVLISHYFASLSHLKGQNSVAMAAHGGDMSTEAWQSVRRCLQAVRDHKAGLA